jgi:hypothetical protein
MMRPMDRPYAHTPMNALMPPPGVPPRGADTGGVSTLMRAGPRARHDGEMTEETSARWLHLLVERAAEHADNVRFRD